MFKLKPFQREDLARLALHLGGILAWDTGLGKGLALYLWPLLKVGMIKVPGAECQVSGRTSRLHPAAPVLMVATEDLHDQIRDEGREHLDTVPITLDSQATFYRLAQVNHRGDGHSRWIVPAGFYLTSYTQLSRNGVTPFPEMDYDQPQRMLEPLNLTAKDVERTWTEHAVPYAEFYRRLNLTPNLNLNLATLQAQWFKRRKAAPNEAEQRALDEAFHTLENFAAPGFAQLTAKQLAYVTLQCVRQRHREYSQGIGETRNYQPQMDTDGHRSEGAESDASDSHLCSSVSICGFAPFKIKCLYSPSLADLAQDAFACVVADEGTKLKGADTYIGTGTRQMNPKYCMVASATPIKNRLPDLFWPAHFATGGHPEPHPRFPYPGTAEAQEDFAQEFMVSERNLTKEAQSKARGEPRQFKKRTPQICQVHVLWKTFASIILRRRKKDCGEQIVQKLRHVVRVPLGKHQAEVYRFHLNAKYKDKNNKPATGARLQALRIAAANPASTLLERPAKDETKGTPRSPYSYVPKLAGALSLIRQILERREQAIVFSAFHDSLDALADRLREAGVPHDVLDGRMSPAARGRAARAFKQGPPQETGWKPVPLVGQASSLSANPIMLAGVECMAEGHSFHRCRNVILMCYSWAYDKFAQAIDRIHRLNSPQDVNVYVIICDGSIDRKLESMIEEKGDACELVLDGHLLGENPTEVNLAELLHIARKEFNQVNRTIDEVSLEREWPKLRAGLARAAKEWGKVKVPGVRCEGSGARGQVGNGRLGPDTPHLAPRTSHFNDLPLWKMQLLRWKKAA